MLEIQVGEYVRTDKGNIGKVIEKRLGKFYKNDNEDIQILKNIYELDIKQWTTDEYIKKHSFNIIDLIEEGDYVNGHKVIKVDRTYLEIDIEDANYGCNYTSINANIDIKSIVTKEQFESMSYKVGN